MSKNERHECYCGKRATRWMLVVQIDWTHAAIWLCDECYEKEVREHREHETDAKQCGSDIRVQN